jgi:hypothetical protein
MGNPSITNYRSFDRLNSFEPLTYSAGTTTFDINSAGYEYVLIFFPNTVSGVTSITGEWRADNLASTGFPVTFWSLERNVAGTNISLLPSTAENLLIHVWNRRVRLTVNATVGGTLQYQVTHEDVGQHRALSQFVNNPTEGVSTNVGVGATVGTMLRAIEVDATNIISRIGSTTDASIAASADGTALSRLRGLHTRFEIADSRLATLNTTTTTSDGRLATIDTGVNSIDTKLTGLQNLLQLDIDNPEALSFTESADIRIVAGGNKRIKSFYINNNSATAFHFQLRARTGGVPLNGENSNASFFVPANGQLLIGTDYFTAHGIQYGISTDSLYLCKSSTSGVFTAVTVSATININVENFV